RLHRQRAFAAARPEREAPVTVGATADGERMQVEERAERLEVEAADDCVGMLAAQQVDEQRRDQRPVDDQPRIALDLGDVAAGGGGGGGGGGEGRRAE